MSFADLNIFAKRDYDKQIADMQAQIDDQKRASADNAYKGPGYEALTQSDKERDAGVTPPGWQGLTDIKTGDLLDKYKTNPFTGEASQRLRNEALSTGPSDYAKTALGQQKFEESQARGKAGLQQQAAQQGAMANLSRMGGLGGGARTSLARSGARDALMAGQGIGAQGIEQRYGINQQDVTRRQGLLGNVADLERQAGAGNLESMKQNMAAKAAFDANRYNQQMAAYGAEKQAQATSAAGRGGGKK